MVALASFAFSLEIFSRSIVKGCFLRCFRYPCNLITLDAAIFPTKIAPKKWDKIHGDGDAFLDKHTAGLINQMGFFLNPMASMLTKRLRDKGLL